MSKVLCAKAPQNMSSSPYSGTLLKINPDADVFPYRPFQMSQHVECMRSEVDMALDFLQIHFPVSGVETLIIIPPLVAFMISFFTSMGGISGAFLLLPFQVSILGFVGPAVSSTNLFYNVVGTPGGVLRYAREKRMVWPLAGAIVCGTMPGVLIGYYCRVKYPAS